MEHSQYINELQGLRNYTHKHGLENTYELVNQLIDVFQMEIGPVLPKEKAKTSATVQTLKDSTCFDRLYKITAQKMGDVEYLPKIGSLSRLDAAVAVLYAERVAAAKMHTQDTVETTEELQSNILRFSNELAKACKAYADVSVFTRTEPPTSDRKHWARNAQPLALTQQQSVT